MILIKSCLIGVSHDYFKLTYANLNEGDKVCECYSRFIYLLFIIIYLMLTFVTYK